MIDHSDSTNGKSPKHHQDKLKADPDRCPDCDETWKALEEMKAGYEEAIELSGLNALELHQENVELRSQLRERDEQIKKLQGEGSWPVNDKRN